MHSFTSLITAERMWLDFFQGNSMCLRSRSVLFCFLLNLLQKELNWAEFVFFRVILCKQSTIYIKYVEIQKTNLSDSDWKGRISYYAAKDRHW